MVSIRNHQMVTGTSWRVRSEDPDSPPDVGAYSVACVGNVDEIGWRMRLPCSYRGVIDFLFFIAVLVTLALIAPNRGSGAANGDTGGSDLFARTNLVAWCIVPFDARKRGPEERAAMLEKLGFKLFAYDYRAEHIPTFDAEMEALQRHHIQLIAWWFPGALNSEARLILDVLKRHELRGVQLWVTGSGEPTRNAAEQSARVQSEADRIRPIALEAGKIGCSVALYNHGGWFGEPENQIEILERLRAGGVTNLGLVYNQHHGHEHLDRFPELLNKMKPYLVALNLNGMSRGGEQILPLGQGELDLQLLRAIRASGWRGPIGILNHTDEDAEARLKDNLDGLSWLRTQLEGQPAGPKPQPRSYKRQAAASSRDRAAVRAVSQKTVASSPRPSPPAEEREERQHC